MPPYYDSLIAKLICHGKDRKEAMDKMQRALSQFVVEGIHTTIPLAPEDLCGCGVPVRGLRYEVYGAFFLSGRERSRTGLLPLGVPSVRTMDPLSGLYAIADAGVLAARGVGLRAFAEGLRAAGVGVVQWRAQGLSPAEVLAGAAVLREVFAGSGTLLVMNDRVDLALLAGFDGVHVGQGDMRVEDVRAVVVGSHSSRRRDEWGTEFLVGISTHTEAEVLALEPRSQNRDLGHPDLFKGPDYVAVGPVFGTSTKQDAAAVVGLGMG